MAPINGESLELEVKHKDNGSWHPCRVSLSSSDSKFGIIINFSNSNEEDIISSREDALARLRFRSTPLQDGECSSIKEGDCVLAMYKDQFRSLFFDAVIEKPYRVKHSNRVFCRCTFEIKWLNPVLEEETETIPSKSIMKLSREEIESHPIFAAFLNALSPTDGVEVPSSLSFLEGTDSEADLQGILEKQIEEISKLADGSMEFSADLLGVKRAKLGGHKQRKAAVASHVSSNNNQNTFRRSTRSQDEEQTEVELKKEVEEDKPFLSPLAARAALASLVHEHELPLQRELNFSRVEKEGQEGLVKKDSKTHIRVHSLDVTCEYMKCGASSQENIPNLSNPIQDGEVDTHVESISRHSNQKGAPKNIKPKKLSYLEKPWQATEVSGEKGSTLTIEKKLIDSTKVVKPSGQSMVTRVTRSSVHKEIEVLSDEVKEESSREKLMSPVNARRKTRSSVYKETESSLDEVKQGSSIEKLTTPVNTARLTRSRFQKEQSTPGFDQEPRKSDPIQVTHGISEESEDKRGSSPTIEHDSIDSTRVRKLSGQPMMTRVTRSSVHKEIEASSNEVVQGSSTKKSESKKKRSIPSLVDPNTELPQENNKRTRASCGATVTTEESGAILEDNDNASVEKKKSERKKAVSSKKPQLRSSPRLNFLPKTRSQKKAAGTC